MGKRERMAELEESVLSEAEAVEVKRLLNSSGWGLFKDMADEMYDVFYHKLLTCKKDEEFYRVQGRIQSVEQLLQLPEQKLEIFNTTHNPKGRGGKNG